MKAILSLFEAIMKQLEAIVSGDMPSFLHVPLGKDVDNKKGYAKLKDILDRYDLLVGNKIGESELIAALRQVGE